MPARDFCDLCDDLIESDEVIYFVQIGVTNSRNQYSRSGDSIHHTMVDSKCHEKIKSVVRGLKENR